MPTLAEVKKRLARMRLERRMQIIEAQKTRTSKGVAAERAILGAGDTALGAVSTIPKFLFDTVPSHIAAGVQGVVGSHGDPGILFGGDFGFQRRLENQEKDKTLLQKGLGNIPQPEVSDLAAFVGAMKQNPSTGKAFGEAFREDKLAFEQKQMVLEDAFPTATKVGDVGADVLSLIALRQPLATGIRTAELRSLGVIPTLGKGIWKDTKTKPAVRKIIRGTGRALETGLEAMALDVLKGDDPLETAVYAASGQAMGSIGLTAIKSIFTGKDLGHVGLKFGATAFAAGSLWQILEDIVPGGRQSIIESIEMGYDKVVLAMLLGMAAGVTGGGRMRGQNILAENYPKIADAIASIPRGITLSILEDLVNSPPGKEKTVEDAIYELSETNEEFRKWLEEE